MNDKDKYAPTGETMKRIAATVRHVETGGALPAGGLKKRHRLVAHVEGVLLQDLAGTDDPNSPATATFQIKSPHRVGNGWSNDVSPSIITVLNRSPSSFGAGTTGFATEISTDKWYFHSPGGAGVQLFHGVILEQCNANCSTYRVQRVHRYLRPDCDGASGSGSGSGSGV